MTAKLRTLPRTARWRWPAVATVGIIAGALLPQTPVRDAATLLPASDVVLRAPPAYVVLAPFCSLLDALTLLGARQHYALLLTVVIAVVTWRAVRGRRWPRRRVWHELGLTSAVLIVSVLCPYAIAVLIPRPMLALQVGDPDVVVVDFHSHTNFSWDGAQGFTVERNRDWHRAGGWNVAYITDHMTLEGAVLGVAANPRRAGDDTILLPGVECRSEGTHFVVLGTTDDDLAMLRDRPGRKRPAYNASHAVIQTIPATLAKIQTRQATRLGVWVGIELSDGDPRGLDQGQRDRAALLELAAHRNLAVVAASNAHRWTTPVAWSLLRIPGWRDLTPAALDREIQDRLRREGTRAVRIVERYGTDAGPTAIRLAATAPAAAWHTLTTLTPLERLSWLAWIWGLALVGSVRGEGRLLRRRAP